MNTREVARTVDLFSWVLSNVRNREKADFKLKIIIIIILWVLQESWVTFLAEFLEN